jgi:hypothetical protein
MSIACFDSFEKESAQKNGVIVMKNGKRESALQCQSRNHSIALFWDAGILAKKLAVPLLIPMEFDR